MTHTILLYGATGFSGRLIAEELALGEGAGGSSRYRVILAGRDGPALADMARERGWEHRIFGLHAPSDVMRGIQEVDVVLNAAGPFALTGNHLVRAALAGGTHYVDVNGEVDVYKKLDDLGAVALRRGCVIVCGAGHTAAASDVLLHAALRELKPKATAAAVSTDPRPLGAVRFGMTRIASLSRGSMETLSRSLRQQVTVVRVGEISDDRGNVTHGHVLWHEPVGRLERAFDFDQKRPAPANGKKKGASQTSALQIATAANLVDTLTARLTVERQGFVAHRIESYVETGTAGRIGYHVGSLLAPVAAMPWARDLARLQISALPPGPSVSELDQQPHTIVLEVDDPFHRTVIDWLWRTPNPYRFTAQVVAEIARCVAAFGPQRAGWLTPSEVLGPNAADLTAREGYLRGCRLQQRTTAALEPA